MPEIPGLDWNLWVKVITILATVAFAVTAVMAVKSDKGIDLFAATVLGLITAIGGGTIRDVILEVPVFWSLDLSYIWIGTIASVVAFYWRRQFSGRYQYVYSAMLYIDGLGAAMFAIQAAAKVWRLGFGLPVAPVILGVITGIGGGLIRDVLAGRTTLLMRRELYAVPLMLGCSIYVVILVYLPEYGGIGGILCILATFALRAAAIHWNLIMPGFAFLAHDKQG